MVSIDKASHEKIIELDSNKEPGSKLILIKDILLILNNTFDKALNELYIKLSCTIDENSDLYNEHIFQNRASASLSAQNSQACYIKITNHDFHFLNSEQNIIQIELDEIEEAIFKAVLRKYMLSSKNIM